MRNVNGLAPPTPIRPRGRPRRSRLGGRVRGRERLSDAESPRRPIISAVSHHYLLIISLPSCHYLSSVSPLSQQYLARIISPASHLHLTSISLVSHSIAQVSHSISPCSRLYLTTPRRLPLHDLAGAAPLQRPGAAHTRDRREQGQSPSSPPPSPQWPGAAIDFVSPVPRSISPLSHHSPITSTLSSHAQAVTSP